MVTRKMNPPIMTKEPTGIDAQVAVSPPLGPADGDS